MNHSPEPWDFQTADNAPIPHVGIYAGDDTFVCSLGDYVPADILRLPEINAARIVQCVNGCRGIVEPEKTVPLMLGELMRRLHTVDSYGYVGCEGLPCECDDCLRTRMIINAINYETHA